MADVRSKLRPLPTPAARIRGRSDVVVQDGLLALITRTETPADAQIADLLFLADALSEAGVEVLLMRDDVNRPFLVVDEAERVAVQRALVIACAEEPCYAVPLKRDLTRRGRPVLIADGELASRDERLCSRSSARGSTRPARCAPTTRVRFEFWVRSGAEVRVPGPERAHPPPLRPARTCTSTTVERYGRTWLDDRATCSTELASDVTFPIDMVFSWVDGTDKEWQRARARADGELRRRRGRRRRGPLPADRRAEVRPALACTMFLPWVRNIYIATDSPAPAWLADHPRVRIMRSEEFFTDPSVLPTHNSQAVESQLHHIPGLSRALPLLERRHVLRPAAAPRDCSSRPAASPGSSRRTPASASGENDPRRSGFENSARVNRALLQERFGRVTTRHLEHAAAPLRTSVHRARWSRSSPRSSRAPRRARSGPPTTSR